MVMSYLYNKTLYYNITNGIHCQITNYNVLKAKILDGAFRKGNLNIIL